MRTRGQAGAGRAAPFQVRREIVREILHRGDGRMRRVDAEATQRAVRHIVRELFEQGQIAVHADAAGNAFECASDALDADTTGHALAAGFFGEVRAALLRPPHHARVLRQPLDDLNQRGFFATHEADLDAGERDGELELRAEYAVAQHTALLRLA